MKKIFLTISICALCAVGILAQGSSAASAGTPTISSPTTKTKSRSPIFRPNKDQIKQVQRILKDKKLYTGEATGKYDTDTRAAIKSFQKDNRLKETGTLNRATLEKFGVPLTEAQKAIPASSGSYAGATDTKSGGASTDGPKRPAPFRANKDQIATAQKVLRDAKLLTGGEEGKLDATTRDALKKYQEANKLKVTGTLNAVTLEKMGITLTDAQRANVAAQESYDSGKQN
ncbi:MAG: peptidoglycan-binding protein [Acidobacteria bacterium]|nr:peptidoglycan-binding protein [Acidobacteriota bacterium]